MDWKKEGRELRDVVQRGREGETERVGKRRRMNKEINI